MYKRQILTLIKDINKKLGITVVVITHQMSVVEEICDHVAILDGGVVVAVSYTHLDVYKRQLLRLSS